MAMRKEPARRYASVGQFSEDIRRHLEGLPVIARKDTVAYRTSKFVNRHRIGVAAAALVVLSLVGGIVATLIQVRTARRERAKAEAISGFLQKTLNASNPAENLGGHPTVKDVLDEASKRLATEELSDQPEVKSGVATHHRRKLPRSRPIRSRPTKSYPPLSKPRPVSSASTGSERSSQASSLALPLGRSKGRLCESQQVLYREHSPSPGRTKERDHQRGLFGRGLEWLRSLTPSPRRFQASRRPLGGGIGFAAF